MKRIYFLTFCVLTMLTACDNRNCPKWQIAGDKIRTPWADQVMPDEVLPEYPRPQLRRTEWQNLNGLWQYALTEKGLPEPAVWDGNILVPFAIESALSGVGRVPTDKQELWYRREFTVPRSWRSRHVLVNFGAVDWRA